MKTEATIGREFRKYPKAIAAELEDHLFEEIARRRSDGMPEEQARREALGSLGDVDSLVHELELIRRDVVWGYTRPPWQLKALVFGWIAFSILCLSRICTHANPTYLSIGTCMVLGLAGSAIGLGLLRRGEWIRRFALGSSLAIAAALFLKSALAGSIPILLPLDPLSLAVLAAGALASAWMLGRPAIRGCCV